MSNTTTSETETTVIHTTTTIGDTPDNETVSSVANVVTAVTETALNNSSDNVTVTVTATPSVTTSTDTNSNENSTTVEPPPSFTATITNGANATVSIPNSSSGPATPAAVLAMNPHQIIHSPHPHLIHAAHFPLHPKVLLKKDDKLVDPWTYAQLSMNDVILKPRSTDQPSESRDFVVGSIKGVDVSALKYNDLRKICVRLRCPNYKNQNKEGMLQLITIAKMKQDGLLPMDYDSDVLPSHPSANTPNASRTNSTVSSTPTATASATPTAASSGVVLSSPHTPLPVALLHDMATNTGVAAAGNAPGNLDTNGKRKSQGSSRESSSSMKKLRQGSEPLHTNPYHAMNMNMGLMSPATIAPVISQQQLQQQEEETHQTKQKIKQAELNLINFERFSKISDRIRKLRAHLSDETNEESIKELEEEIEQLKKKKAELSRGI